MKSLLDYICKKYNLLVQENLKLGYNSDSVCIAVNKNGDKVVVKAAKTKNAIAEIRMNSTGYDNLRKCGLDFFIPEIFAYESSDDYAFIVMEYLGSNFLYQAEHSENPLEFYMSLMDSLEKVYRVSLKMGAEGHEAVESFIGKTIEIYEKYVCPNLDKERQIFPLLQRMYLSINIPSVVFCCFSNWDFTLEDVYLTNAGVKYSDPHADVLGIPIIDMACFGGLIKLYGLPCSDEGYEEFKKFATGAVAEILRIPTGQAEKIFYLGKLFQCFMSIRFRYEKNPEQTKTIFAEAKEVIEKII
ncbi:hypothetical protein BMS3Abin15_01168 [bacterium BMS3Abin15]|nr:hypothetical protein BMS3Abin15_01168 [bacterium BMS3Abin15]HDH07534.1 hypothetical protein [Candidatus Moranbacteria bacterium]HDZ85168.1 hypothetical protein [Candidatus Moranbacteria bacterium]